LKIALLSVGERKAKKPTIEILLLTLITLISVSGIDPISILTSAFADSCIWPQCYFPEDNNQQYGSDDNCKAPDCLIDLNKGVLIYSPHPTDNTSPKSGPSNRQDLFNNVDMCKAIQNYLASPCSFYVDSNGVLSAEGKRAKDCIVGGGFISAAGLVLHLPALGIIKVLETAAPIYNCDGLVKWELLRNDVGAATQFLQLVGIL
jgi:hypothetical protein